ncbi:MAG TPA: PKD domain-containing protein, partial [Chitinophagales bacterium]|nr:PKD domain-containing protein [Chitinophagales bacterium]
PVSVVDFSLQYQNGPLTGQFVPPNGIGQFEVCGNVGFLKLVGNPLATTGIAPTFFAPSNPNSATLALHFSQVGPDFFIDTNGLPSGDYAVTYTYTNSLGATSSPFTRAIKVFASPTAGIIPPANNCIVSAINLVDNSTMPPPAQNPFSGVITGWVWNFGDGNLGSGASTSHNYTAPGVYPVILDVITNQGCRSSANLSLRVGPQPLVDFNWSAICTNDLTKFLDQTNPGISTITTYSWDFGDGDVLLNVPAGGTVPGGTHGGRTTGTYKDPQHNYVSTGTYPTLLTVNTNDGCTNSKTRSVFILTGGVTVQPNAASPYYVDFESANGWIAEGLQLPAPAPPGTLSPISWIFGTPAGNNMNSASSGSKSWWTGDNIVTNAQLTYYDLETSAVNGPCFDLTQLKRPMISLDYWSDAEKNLDGAVVQYSTNGGLNWSIVGPLAGLTGSQRDQGINWCDPNATIVSNPGQQLIGQYGWTDKSGGWKNARFNLDMVDPLNRGQVRVRVAFSSNDKNAAGASYDGFAFDNVYVGEKQRNVLVEHFTNSSLIASVTGDAWINQRYQDQLTTRGTSDFYDIQYHINFPNADLLNIDNPTDPAGRSLYFGVSQPPATIMDGILDGVKFKGNYTDIDANGVEVDRRALKDPAFDLTMTGISASGNNISVTLNITARKTINTPLIAQVALLENQVVNGAGTFKNVLRKQLFGPDGETITLPFTGPPSATTVSKVHNNVAVNVPIVNPSQLTLVAYIQDKNTKEIYQSLVMPAPPVTGAIVTAVENPGPLTTLNGITIYPIPAKGSFYFGLPDAKSAEGFAWRLIDQRGITVKSGTFDDMANSTRQVDVTDLANGIYFVTLTGPGGSVVYRKIVVLN